MPALHPDCGLVKSGSKRRRKYFQSLKRFLGFFRPNYSKVKNNTQKKGWYMRSEFDLDKSIGCWFVLILLIFSQVITIDHQKFDAWNENCELNLNLFSILYEKKSFTTKWNFVLNNTLVQTFYDLKLSEFVTFILRHEAHNKNGFSLFNRFFS